MTSTWIYDGNFEEPTEYEHGIASIIIPSENEDFTDGGICITSDNPKHAYLIAAAPDLLAACEALLSVNSYWWQEANGADDLIRAAVKKAKGE